MPTPRVPDLAPWFPIDTPTLHIIGKVDVIISTERSLALVDKCNDARVEYHDGGESAAPSLSSRPVPRSALTRVAHLPPGHFVPSKGSFRNFFRDYIGSFAEGGLQGDVPPPASAPATPAPSAPQTREGSPDK